MEKKYTLRLKGKIALALIALLVINCFVIISSAPSIITHPISHFLFIVLGVANLFAIGYVEYLVEWDSVRRMKI